MRIDQVMLFLETMLNVDISTNDPISSIVAGWHFLVCVSDALCWNLMKVASRSVKFLCCPNVLSHLFFLLASCNFNFFIIT